MKKPLLKLLILSTLIYANTYNTKAENTLHSTSTDRHATAEYWEKNKNYERVKLLKEVITAIVVGCLFYYLWSTLPLRDYLEKVPIVYGNPSVICIKRKRYEVLPWYKTIYYHPAEDRLCGNYLYMPCQYKVTLGGKKYLCKEFSSYKQLEIYQRLNETGAVPKIIKCYQLHSFPKKKDCLCIMEYPSPIEGPIERIKACIDGLKKINKKGIEHLNISPYDMVEHYFVNFNQRKNRWCHDFYNGDQHDKEKGEKKQIISLARSVLADEYRREIRKSLEQRSRTACDEYHYEQYLPILLDLIRILGENKLDTLSKVVKEIIGKNKEKSEQKANYEEQRIKLLSVLVKAGKGEIETFDSFLAEFWVSKDTIKKILAYWGREMSINVPDDINNTIIDYCC